MFTGIIQILHFIVELSLPQPVIQFYSAMSISNINEPIKASIFVSNKI